MPREKKTTYQKKMGRNAEKKPTGTVVFNGKSYSSEKWDEYCKSGEPGRIISDYFNSDRCPPDRKAAWRAMWDSIFTRTLGEMRAEEEEHKKQCGEQSNTSQPDRG